MGDAKFNVARHFESIHYQCCFKNERTTCTKRTSDSDGGERCGKTIPGTQNNKTKKTWALGYSICFLNNL